MRRGPVGLPDRRRRTVVELLHQCAGSNASVALLATVRSSCVIERPSLCCLFGSVGRYLAFPPLVSHQSTRSAQSMPGKGPNTTDRLTMPAAGKGSALKTRRSDANAGNRTADTRFFRSLRTCSRRCPTAPLAWVHTWIRPEASDRSQTPPQRFSRISKRTARSTKSGVVRRAAGASQRTRLENRRWSVR